MEVPDGEVLGSIAVILKNGNGIVGILAFYWDYQGNVVVVK